MSRREGRDSVSRRHRSRFDQEPSPKRSRRDGKPETERPPANINLENQDRSDGDQKHRRRLQDALPLEAPSVQVSNALARSKDSEKANIDGEGTKFTDPMDMPRSRSYFQHDERGNAGQVGRGFSRKAPSDRGWWRDPKEHQNERGNNITTGELPKKDERTRGHGEGNDTWRHDRYSVMERDPKPLPRKRSFREKKDSDESEKANKVVDDPVKPNSTEHSVLESDRRNERGSHPSRHVDQPNRVFGGEKETDRGEGWRGYLSSRDRRHVDQPNRVFGEEKEADRGEGWRGYLSSRDRYSSNRSGNYRGRDRFASRGSYRPTSTGGRVDKWKHDLYDEANRSPSPKNEEDVVAKVEALLAS